MPWAKTGWVGSDQIEGSVEITDDQYQAALAATQVGKQIVVLNGVFRIVGGPVPTGDANPVLDDYRLAIQTFVDAVAQAREFNDGVTAATYLTSTVPRWKADAEAFVAWRDQVWLYAYGELAKVQNGQRPQPAIEAFINELPAVSWPDEVDING